MTWIERQRFYSDIIEKKIKRRYKSLIKRYNERVEKVREGHLRE